MLSWTLGLRFRSHLLPRPSCLHKPRFYSTTLTNMGAQATHTVDTTKRLEALRGLMSGGKVSVDAYVVPSEDQHSSEYLAHCDERRAFISGFNGSAGCAVITKDQAYLFTDGRYFLQAEKQLDKNWTLMKQGLADVPTWKEFVSKRLETKTRLGIDPSLISAGDAQSFEDGLNTRDSTLVSLEQNLVDIVWGSERPSRPKSAVEPLDVKYAGQAHHDKIAKVREELEKKKVKALVVTMLDEVAWLFNLRGSDIDFNPVFFAYAVVTPSTTSLFIDPAQVSDAVRAHLGDDIEIRTYDEFFGYLKGLGEELKLGKDEKVLIGDKSSQAVANALGKDNIKIARSPIASLKSIKNSTEVEGFRACHIRDGAALAKYFAWLEEELTVKGNEGLSEWKAAEKLEGYRSEGALFKGLSFTTISSTGPNGAIIHYSPDPNDCAIIKKDQIYLCDSGGQYLDGTTDVTRTWHFGTPTAEEKRAFTRVLQGHIAIDKAVFPNGTTGTDSWARRALWEDGLDYRHGTGHGVGHFLNVHEGPHGIGVHITYNSTPLKAGMTVSNEPGYYADGKFGIRIENIVIVQEAKTPNNFGDKGFLSFEHVTVCPIHKKLIDTELLTAQEKTWLNNYHAETWEKVSPLLQNDTRALEWLKRECAPL
ncbi:hypothetical protein JAAARDRAFT_711428 [Jaapia argillacea MUCL 33604]|uniref:Aminopeptidase P N-terminal domain-containing protein n=1 Tax=Jaapia argillacea MUCL 33604 TaxID=933084 RepID=A0A067QBP2_9AGAM|nr:hypothetical protein JAAARDRAFT_711428 [Jaapia argillacea MUCL 33604]